MNTVGRTSLITTRAEVVCFTTLHHVNSTHTDKHWGNSLPFTVAMLHNAKIITVVHFMLLTIY